MLVPKITASTTLSPTLQRAIGLLPSVLYTDASAALVASEGDAAVWADVSVHTDVQDLLNSGVAVAVFGPDDQVSVDCDRARIALRYAATSDCTQSIGKAQTDGIVRAGAVVIELTASQLEQATQKDAAGSSALSRLTKAADKQLLGSSGPVRVLVEVTDAWTIDLLARAADAGADSVVAGAALSLEEGVGLSLAAAFMAGSGLVSDRTDGLFTTVVVDEQRVCLGVVYSSAESITAALAAGEGVYWSRRRGLWHKGLTSGATQTLLGLAVDCDSDALCFRVRQSGAGFCHHATRGCFGPATGIAQLAQVLEERLQNAPAGSYTARLFADAQLLRAKLLEEATELAEATEPADVAFEASDLLYFALAKCAAHGVSLADIERSLDRKHRKVVRRPGNSKPEFEKKAAALATGPAPVLPRTSILSADIRAAEPGEAIRMRSYDAAELTPAEYAALLQRPIIDSEELMGRVRPIVAAVRANGDAAVRELTRKFDRVELDQVVLRAPFTVPELPAAVRQAIDQAYSNVHKFHSAQLAADISVETMPGVTCSRFSRAIERVGLYVPGGTAVLPSTALMLGVPAQVAGCREIVMATPPRSDGSVVPEVLYVAHKVGATAIVKAGGAQAIAAMA
ncbi:trifunctional histidinol dehydrogenase, partial [Kickxella alabastrina]